MNCPVASAAHMCPAAQTKVLLVIMCCMTAAGLYSCITGAGTHTPHRSSRGCERRRASPTPRASSARNALAHIAMADPSSRSDASRSSTRTGIPTCGGCTHGGVSGLGGRTGCAPPPCGMCTSALQRGARRLVASANRRVKSAACWASDPHCLQHPDARHAFVRRHTLCSATAVASPASPAPATMTRLWSSPPAPAIRRCSPEAEAVAADAGTAAWPAVSVTLKSLPFARCMQRRGEDGMMQMKRKYAMKQAATHAGAGLLRAWVDGAHSGFCGMMLWHDCPATMNPNDVHADVCDAGTL